MKYVYIPLISGNDTNITVAVKKGDYVYKGTVIGKRKGIFRIPIHSSVSGTVIDYEEKYVSNGKKVKCVVIEKLRNRRKIIRVVVVVGVLHSDIVTLEFHKQKRDAIDKADYIGTAAINFAVNFHLLDGEKIVILRIQKINDKSPLDIRSSIRFLVRDRNAIANKAVLFFVDLKQ